MRKEKLYTGNKVYFSIHKRDGMEESDFIRLTAEEGKAITDGEDITTTADVPEEYAEQWVDCEKPVDDFATEADYKAALRAMGVDV